MLQYIHLKNFQSHVDTYLEFAPDLTCITGDNNAGKTAILRAVYTLAFNPSGLFNKYGRYGKSPRIELGWNGHTIVRDKDGYILDGIRFEAIRGQVPKDIQTVLNLSPQINFKLQRTNLFLVTEPPGQRAKLISSLTGLAGHEDLLKYCAEQIRDLNVDIATTSRMREEINRKLRLGLPLLQEIEPIYQKAEENTRLLQQYMEEEEKISELLYSLQQVQRISSVADDLAIVQESFEETEEKTQRLTELYSSQKRIINLYNRLITASQLVDLSDHLSLASEQLRELNRMVDKWQKLNEQYRVINVCISKIKKAKEEAKEASVALEYTRKEKHSLLKQLKVCPTCGRSYGKGVKHEH